MSDNPRTPMLPILLHLLLIAVPIPALLMLPLELLLWAQGLISIVLLIMVLIARYGNKP